MFRGSRFRGSGFRGSGFKVLGSEVLGSEVHGARLTVKTYRAAVPLVCLALRKKMIEKYEYATVRICFDL